MLIQIDFENKPLLFDHPSRIISCDRLDDIPECFAQMEEALLSGFFLAGFFSYEAGCAFEERLLNNKVYDFPLIYFGVYDSFTTKRRTPPNELGGIPRISMRGSNISFSGYTSSIDTIRSHIESGNTYQITYCLKYNFRFDGDPFILYRQLKKEQPVPYPAFIETRDFSILSLSPEMFLKKSKDKMTVKPMKGTWMRGKNLWDDIWAKRRLHLDPKNRAENVMIADLLRNDLGKISESGSVATPKLFEVARYRTVCQMTSTVQSVIDPAIKLFDLFKAIYPSGSVTGAPKLRAMQIIRELEKEDRRIYTGAIGYITPRRDMFFNVPIRTLLIRNGRGEMGVGGGIVWDSTPEGEWEECRIKAEFLVNKKLGK